MLINKHKDRAYFQEPLKQIFPSQLIINLTRGISGMALASLNLNRDNLDLKCSYRIVMEFELRRNF